MSRTVRPDWVKPGGQWSSGQTFEDYKATGQPVNPSYASTTTPSSTPVSIPNPQPASVKSESSGIVIPTGDAAIGKSVRIDGKLYPSQEWYDVKVLGKNESSATSNALTDTPDEGSERINPQTGEKERYSPLGWRGVDSQGNTIWEGDEILEDDTNDLLGDSGDARSAEDDKKQQEDEKNKELADKDAADITKLTNAGQIAQLKSDLSNLGFDYDMDTGTMTKRPGLPTYESDFDALRDEHGMDAIDTQLNNINKLMADKEESLRQGLYDIEGKIMSMENVSIAQRELNRQGQEDMDELTRRKAALVDEYNTKANLINNIMNLKQMDYAAASNAYNTAFTQSVNLLNIIEGRTDKAQQEATAATDDARANLTILTNLASSQGTSWSGLEDDMKSQITSLELKAGIPSGVVKSLMNSDFNSDIDYVSTGVNSDGQYVASFFSYNNGNPKLISTIPTGAVKTSSGDGEGSVPGIDAYVTFFQQFKDKDWTREDCERQFRAENKIAVDETLPSVVIRSLDQLYAEPTKESGGLWNWLKDEVWSRVPFVK